MSDNYTLSNNLRHLLKMHDTSSLSELARQTQIPQPTLHHLFSGTTKKPRKVVLEKLASFFSVSIQQLTGLLPFEQIIPETIKQQIAITTIPIIDWQSARTWPASQEPTQGFPILIMDKLVSENSFALLMPDSSMEPLFPKDAVLIFDAQKTPRDRDFVLLYNAQNDNLLFNRVFIEGQDRYIKVEQHNNTMQLIKINTKCDKIIATLIEVRMQF